MPTKMKGLMKGLRYFSQIFDEEKEEEMQIGLPTDVKHVAHIGHDGPAATQESPSWMKEFTTTSSSSSGGHEDAKRGTKDNSGSTLDAKRGQRTRHSQGKDNGEAPKPSRRQTSTENSSDVSPKKKDPSTKARQTRRKEGKDSSEGGVRVASQDLNGVVAPDIPKKSRKKKSKELVNEGESRGPRNRGTTSNDSEPELEPQKLNFGSTSVPSDDDDDIRPSRVTFK